MRPEKQLLLDEVKSKMDRSKAVVFAKYQGLDVNTASQFRMTLNESGAHYFVVRKRLLKKAAEAAGVALEPTFLDGHIGVVFIQDDPVAATKVVCDFQKEAKEKFQVVGGVFEGRSCSAQDVVEIAKLPNLEEMRAQLLATFEAPMSQTLSVIDALLTSVIHCLENKKASSE